MLHRILTTTSNCFLFRIGITPNDQCTFCKAGSETLLCLFWEYFCVKFFWNGIANWMRNSSCCPNQDFSFLSCIGFMSDTTKLLIITTCTFNCKVPHLSHCEVSHLLLKNNVLLPSRELFTWLVKSAYELSGPLGRSLSRFL